VGSCNVEDTFPDAAGVVEESEVVELTVVIADECPLIDSLNCCADNHLDEFQCYG
jgi:hypothetical protein